MNRMLLFLPALLLVTLGMSLPLSARAAPQGVTFTVNTIADEPDAKPGDGKCKATPSKQCTLRAAVMETNALAGKDTIVLPANASFYTLTYTGAYNDNARTGDLDILDDLVIQGSGASNTIISGYNSDRVFHILAGKVKISKIKIIDGTATGNFNFGGGINVEAGATLTLVKSILENNSSWYGGGIYSKGKATIKNSTLRSNNAAAHGGGISADTGGSMTIQSGTLTQNTAGGKGGAIANWGALFVNASTLDHNNANEGAGINNSASGAQVATVVNSTFANNIAEWNGGAFFNYGALNLFSVTASLNQASNSVCCGKGAGIYTAVGATTNVRNSLFDWNTYPRATPPFFDPGDCEGTLNSQDYNLFSTTNNCSFTGVTTHHLDNQPSYVGFLGNNGGPTQTMALPIDSVAVDVIPAANCVGPNGLLIAPLTRDQRNQPRPHDGNGDGKKKCDIGAFER